MKRNLHIAAQLAGLAAQSLVPSLPLTAEIRAWIVPIIAFIQGALALVALYSEPPATGGKSSGSGLPPLTGAVVLAVLASCYGAVSLYLGVVS